MPKDELLEILLEIQERDPENLDSKQLFEDIVMACVSDQ